MPQARFEPAIPASERPYTYASNWQPRSAILNLNTTRKKGWKGRRQRSRKRISRRRKEEL
jgi:hypothetical protein